MFPNLARASVLGGADILFVATNDVWFGEEGAAEFHAAHSVLRAVENRRPVIRSGNAGWSGWSDPMGNVRGLGYFSLSVRGSYTSAFDSEVRSSMNS